MLFYEERFFAVTFMRLFSVIKESSIITLHFNIGRVFPARVLYMYCDVLALDIYSHILYQHISLSFALEKLNSHKIWVQGGEHVLYS